nr:MAG TPA: hypothetical protein [Bacteriophage sp.]
MMILIASSLSMPAGTLKSRKRPSGILHRSLHARSMASLFWFVLFWFVMLPQYIGIICAPLSQLWRFVDFDRNLCSIHIIAHFHRFVKRNLPDFPAIVRFSVRACALVCHEPFFLIGLHPNSQLPVKVLQRLASQVVQVGQDKVFRQVAVKLHDRQLILCVGLVHDRFLQLPVYHNGGFAVFQLLENGFERAAVFVVFGNSSICKTAINNGLPNGNFKLLHFNGVFLNDIPYSAIVGGQLDNSAFCANFKRPVKLEKGGLYHHAARLELQTETRRSTRLHHKAIGFRVEHNGIAHAQQLIKKRVIVPANLSGACFRQAMDFIKCPHTLEKRTLPVVEYVRTQRRGTKPPACLRVIVPLIALVHGITFPFLFNKYTAVHSGVNICGFGTGCHRCSNGKSARFTIPSCRGRNPHNGITVQTLISGIVNGWIVQ